MHNSTVDDAFAHPPSELLGLALASAAGLSTGVGALLLHCRVGATLSDPRFLVILLALTSGSVLYCVLALVFPDAQACVAVELRSWKTQHEACASGMVSCTAAATVMLAWLVDALCHVFNVQPQQEDSFDCSPFSSTAIEGSMRGSSGEETAYSLVHIVDEATSSKDTLHRSGLAKLIAFACHCFIEGFVISLAVIQNQEMGVVLAITVALFNFTETLAIGGLLRMTTGVKTSVFMPCASVGLAAPMGGMVAWWLIQTIRINYLATGLLYAAMGGLLIGLVLTQVLPVCFNFKSEGGYVVTASVFGGTILMASVRMVLLFVLHYLE